MFYSLALLAYLIDMLFGEFEKLKFIKHPIILMGDYIKWFEKKFYKDSVLAGSFLTFSLILLVGLIAYAISFIDNIYIPY